MTRLPVAIAIYVFAHTRLRRFVRVQRRAFFACLRATQQHRSDVQRVVTSEGSIAICDEHGVLYEAFMPGVWE